MFIQSPTPTKLLALLVSSIAAVAVGPSPAIAQTTAFTYQGKLGDGGSPANGSYDFQFKLFDLATPGVGNQQGSTLTQTNVSVAAGAFTVQLDFGVCPSCFPGAKRYLEIAVKLPGDPNYTVLTPRQQVLSAPYSVKSLNAASADGLSVACVNCVTSNQIASVSGSVVTGTIPVSSVPSGSADYIQNTTSQQASSDFNISGEGKANVFDAATQYNINGNRVLSDAGTQNLFAGAGAGQANAGSYNAFFGWRAGNANTIGEANSFFGESSGLLNTTGHYNSFFGTSAGRLNTTGFWNSFFGTVAGYSNATGENNSFFGQSAGYSNTTGARNSFFGSFAGVANNTGADNSFFGYAAGGAGGSKNSFFGSLAGADSTGAYNSFFGYQAGRRSTTGSANSFFGYQAGMSTTTAQSNSFFGYNAGVNTVLDGNSFFGANAGSSNTLGTDNSFFGLLAGTDNTTGYGNSFFGLEAGRNNRTGYFNTVIGTRAYVGSDALNYATAIGAGAIVNQSNSLVLGSIGTRVGIGTSAPLAQLDVRGDVYVGLSDVSGVNIPGNNLYVANDFGDQFNSFRIDGYQNNLYLVSRSVAGAGAGAGIVFRTASAGGGEIDRLGIDQNGFVYINNLASAPNGTHLCRNFSTNQIGDCFSSSLRYKTGLRPYTGGLSIINSLQPISFTWRNDETPDIGLGAEDVAEVEPKLTYRNGKGEIEGVKYDHLALILINAVKEQQAEIKGQQARIRERERQASVQQQQIEQYRRQLAVERRRNRHQQVQLINQRSEIDALKCLVCVTHPKAAMCKSTPRTR